MDERFKIKQEFDAFKQEFCNLDSDITDAYKCCYVLNNYCKAYKDEEGIYYLLPYVEHLEKIMEKITKQIIRIKEKGKNKENCFEEIFKNFDWSQYIIED